MWVWFFMCVYIYMYLYEDLIFIFSCAGSLLLSAISSGCDKRGLLLIVTRGLLIKVASLLQSTGLGHA